MIGMITESIGVIDLFVCVANNLQLSVEKSHSMWKIRDMFKRRLHFATFAEVNSCSGFAQIASTESAHHAESRYSHQVYINLYC